MTLHPKTCAILRLIENKRRRATSPKRTLRLKRTTQSQNRDSNNNQVKRTSLNPSRDLNHSHSLPWIFPRQPIRVLRYKMAMKERPPRRSEPEPKDLLLTAPQRPQVTKLHLHLLRSNSYSGSQHSYCTYCTIL